MLEDAGLLAPISFGPLVDTNVTLTWDDNDEHWFGNALDTNRDVLPPTGFLDLHNTLIVGDAVIGVDLGWLLELEAGLLIAAQCLGCLFFGGVDLEGWMHLAVH